MKTLLTILLASALLLTIAPAFATVGGSWYGSQLGSIGAGNVSYGRTSDWTSTGYTVNASPTAALDLEAGEYPHSMASIYTSVQQPSFMEWDLPSGTFNAQTVFAYRNTLFPFDTNGPWHLEIFDGSTWQPINGLSGTGAPNNGTIAMANPKITGTKLRAIYDPLTTTSGLYFMSMGEIVVLPDALEVVPNATASASSFFGAPYLPASGIDNQLGANKSWFSAPGDSNAWFTLTFAAPSRVDALLLSKWDQNTGTQYTNAIVDIYINGTLAGAWTNGTQVADNVELKSANSYGNFNAFKFDSPLLNVTDLTLQFVGPGRTTDGGQGLGEIIPLSAMIPEPHTIALLGLGAALIGRRRNGASW